MGYYFLKDIPLREKKHTKSQKIRDLIRNKFISFKMMNVNFNMTYFKS